MKVLTFHNLKGGVAKTTTAINTAHILSKVHGYRVLLIDNDKQGNTSKFFNMHDYEQPSITDVLTVKGFSIAEAIRQTKYDRLHLLPSNMNVLRANKEILLDYARPQQTRLRDALKQVQEKYDFIVIDCAPDYNMSEINALVASDHVVIPIKIDQFTFDGVEMILEQVEDIRNFNPSVEVVGGLVTMFDGSPLHRQCMEWLRNQEMFPIFDVAIRRSLTIDRMTFSKEPIIESSPQSNPASDYNGFVNEYLRRIGTILG